MIIDVLYRKLQTELSDYEIDSAIAIYDIAKEYSFSYISVKEWQYINTSGLTRARTREEQDKLQKLMSAIGR